MTYDTEDWLPVPSLGYRYELSKKGSLRNVKTKHVMTLRKDGYYEPCIDGVRTSVSVKSLMWEVYGVEHELSKYLPVSCMAFKNGACLKFDSLKALAKFLAQRSFYSVVRMQQLLTKRSAEILGWQIKYGI